MPTPAAITALISIAENQAGAFSIWQAAHAGITKAALKHGLTLGRYVRLHRGVLAIAGSPDTPERRLWAAQLALGPDAVASHRSAIWLWELGSTKSLDAVDFTVPVNHKGNRPGIEVHRIADIKDAHVSSRKGIRVTSPLRTLVDAGAVLRPPQVEDVFDRAVSRRLASPAAVLAEIERLSQHGRTGVGVLRSVLLEQGVGTDRSPSYLEAKARRLFRRAGLPEPVCELKWGDHGQFRLDFTWPELGLVVEVDGWDCHSSHQARQHDLSRRNQITLGGETILIYTYGDIVRRGSTTIREISEAMSRLRPPGSPRP